MSYVLTARPQSPIRKDRESSRKPFADRRNIVTLGKTNKKAKKMRANVILTILAAFLVGALVAVVVISQSPVNVSHSTKTTGKPLIGGSFELTDHSGNRVTDKDFLGKYLLVYFGYTYCPDVCPTELQVIANAIDKLGEKSADITPLFVSIDPERDTPEQLASYVEHFHKKMVGLTGSAEDIRNIAKLYKVYYSKAEDGDADESSEADYLMNHSNIIYFMDKEGHYVTHFTHTTDPDALAKKIAKLL